MTFRLELTSNWPLEKMIENGEAITRCLKAYVDEFPEWETLQNMFEEIQNGTRQLWVVFKDDVIVSALLTEIETIRATGKKVCRYAALGGVDGVEAVPAITGAVEVWAKEQGCDFCEMYGRRGWIKALKPLLYREEKAIFRKNLT